jgi:hypothetical protein
MTGETGGLVMQETAAGASEEVVDATGEGPRRPPNKAPCMRQGLASIRRAPAFTS